MASWGSGKYPRSPRLPKVKSYQDIVLHIIDQLQESDIETWVFLRDDVVPPKHQELCSRNSLHFFKFMKQKDIYTEDHPEHLVDDLGRLKKYSLQKDVQTLFADLRGEHLQTPPPPNAAATQLAQFSKQTSGQLQPRSVSLSSMPCSQRSNQSTGGAMDGQIGRVMSDPGASPNQMLCFENPVEEPPRSQPLNVQPSSTTESAKSGQLQQKLDIPDYSGDQNLTPVCISVPGSLRSTEPVGVPDGQYQVPVMNIHPDSQQSNQSNRGAMDGQDGKVQSAKAVSNHQKHFVGQPMEQLLRMQPSSTTGSAQISGEVPGVQHPSDDQLMNPGAFKPSGIQDIEEMNGGSTSQLLNAQPSSTTESAQTSGQPQQSPGVPHLSPESRGHIFSGIQDDGGAKASLKSLRSQPLNVQPSSTTESMQTSAPLQQSLGVSHPFKDLSKAPVLSGIQDDGGAKASLNSLRSQPLNVQPSSTAESAQTSVEPQQGPDIPLHFNDPLRASKLTGTCDDDGRMNWLQSQAAFTDVQPTSTGLNESFAHLTIATRTEVTETLPSDLSVPGFLRSTETVVPREGEPQLMNVSPSSQQPSQSVRKRPMDGQSASVQSHPDVSPKIARPHSLKSPTLNKPTDSTTPPAQTVDPLQQRHLMQHASDEPSMEARASTPTSIPGNDGIASLKSRTPELMNMQPESAQSTTGPPDQPKQAWPPNSIPTSQSGRRAPPQRSQTHPPISFSTTSTCITTSEQRVTAFQGGSEVVESLHTLSNTETEYSQQSESTNMHVHVEQFQEDLQVSQATGTMSVEDIMKQFSPEDSVKDGRSMLSNSLDDIADLTDDLTNVVLEDKEDKPEPVIKKKTEDEKEKDDEDEKDKCDEKEIESEDEVDKVWNIPEASGGNIKHTSLDEENVYREEKKEELPSSSPDLDTGKFEASEGSWPALAVAQKLSEEKAKKEEEEAKIEYDPTTGIEKALYDKMVHHPETLSPEEHEQIKKQMMQHLQKKANPMKKNEPELPFDPEGRLSEYQKELGLPGLMGFNYIICAPSRTGKVLTTATVCNHQRNIGIMKDKKKPLKFLFITPEDRVKERHRRAFEEVFPQGSVVALDSTAKFREVFDQPSVSVVMLTGVRLSVALNDGDLKFVEVHTMIIDQCHLVASDHPGIGDVIRHYLLEKKLILARKAPKGAWTLGKPYGGISSIIGLSPHLGAGMRQFSRDNIVQQCGLLDSKGIRRVETVENLTALLETNKPPQMDTMLLSSPSSSSVKGTFRSVVEKIMGEIEEKFSILPETPEEGERKKLLHPTYGTENYTAWITPLFHEAKLCKDEEKYAPAMFLVKLNEVLMVNEDLRPKEAMAHLEEVQKLKLDQDYQGSSGNTCYKTVNEQRPELKRLAETDQAGLTTKLMCLAQKLAKIYKDDPKALGLVICRCPAVAKYLTKIIRESNITISRKILPKHLEALGQCEDEEESQNLARQRGIIDEFQDEVGANLVISTDFEQVDLELSECHFVIRYNVACDEIGTIHWSGRMKARKDLCFLITESGTMITDQEENKREALKELEKHLKVLNDMDPKNWYDIVENKQLACLRNNAHRDFMVNFQRFCRRAADYTLLCRNCRKFICNAHFLLKRGTHVSCQDSSIKERFSVAGLTSPMRGSEDDTTGVLKCTGQKDGQPCQNKLGLAIDFKRQEIEEGYGLDAKGFYFSFLQGQHADYVGQDFDTWDDVDFFIYSEERSDRRGRSGGGGDDDDDDGMDDDDNNRGGGSADGDDSKKKKESGTSGGGGGRTRTTEQPRSEETQMETETVQSRRRRPNKDGGVDR